MKKLNSLIFISFTALLHIKSFAVNNKKIDDLVYNFMQKNQVEGMSIAVIDNAKINLFNYGYTDDKKEKPTTSDTIYTIASFTKTVTATLAGIASVEKKIDLDKPFINYFPGLKNKKNLGQITPRELLGHTATFPFDFLPRPKNYLEIVERLHEYELQNKPGTVYSYSNAGIGTVGYILENIYEKDYQHILNEKILNPLLMTSTYLKVPVKKQKYITLGHDRTNQPILYNKSVEAWFGAASLKSTISDMANYLSAHINDDLISNRTIAKAIKITHENTYCFSNKLACEQLAWQGHVISELKQTTGDTYFIRYENGMPVFDTKQIEPNDDFSKQQIFIDKTGSGYGMSSYMAYIPTKKMGVVILLNKDVGDARIQLGRNILSLSKLKLS